MFYLHFAMLGELDLWEGARNEAPRGWRMGMGWFFSSKLQALVHSGR